MGPGRFRLLLLASLAVAGPAAAGEVPSSAGIALRTPGVLLDEAPLQYVFPQAALGRAVGTTRLELEYARFRGPETGFLRSIGVVAQGSAVSGVVAAGAGRLFVQHRDEFDSATGRTSYGVLEIGAALAQGEWTLGLAVAVGPLVSRRLLIGNLFAIGQTTQGNVSAFHTRGAAVGLGWRRNRAGVDAVVRYDDERAEFSSTNVNSQQDTGRIVSADVESQRFSTALRVALPAGERWHVTAFGEWLDLPVDGRGLRWNLEEEPISFSGRTKGHALRAAARAVRGVPGESAWAVQLDWRRKRTSPRDLGQEVRADQLEVGISHRRPLPWGLEMLAGWSVTWWETQEQLASVSSNSVTHHDLQNLTDGFSWGLVGRWQRLEIASVVAGNLELFGDHSSRPFLALDARLRL